MAYIDVAGLFEGYELEIPDEREWGDADAILAEIAGPLRALKDEVRVAA